MNLPPFLLLLFLSVHPISVSATENNRTLTVSESECSCPYKLIYKCTSTSKNFGGDSLVWNGSAFNNCDNFGILLLLHGNMTSYNDSCNESIVGTLMSDDNSRYTSYLHVTLNFDIIEKSIQCIHYDDEGQTSVIGNTSITVDIPHNIELLNNPAQNSLYFQWSSSISFYCPAVQYTYGILASNCGICPATVNHTNATCINVPTNGGTCNFTVKTYVCGKYIGSSPPHLFSLKRARSNLLPNLTTGILLLIIIAVLIIGIIVLLWFLFKRHTFTESSAAAATHCQAQNSLVHETDTNVYDGNTTIVKVFDNKLASGIYGSAPGEVHRSQYEDYVPTIAEGKIDLESLIAYLRGRVTFQWYKFGAALGVPSNVLERFVKDSGKYSEENALIKVLEYWLKNHPTQPSWHEVANALRDIIWTS